MEIERKWMVTGWPEGLPLEEEFTTGGCGQPQGCLSRHRLSLAEKQDPGAALKGRAFGDFRFSLIKLEYRAALGSPFGGAGNAVRH